MSPVQQQRLAGIIFLLCIISGIALFLMTNTHDSDKDNVKVSKPMEDVFSSSIKVISEGDVEVVEDELATSLERHDVKMTALTEKKLKPEIEKAQAAVEPAPITDIKKISNTTKVSWFLQLGSFSVEDNAQKLQTKVTKLGYKAHLLPVKVDKGTIYRVRIGPDTNKSSLEATALTLKNKLQLEPQLIQNK